MAIIVFSIWGFLLLSDADRAGAILVQPSDNEKYKIEWSWDSNSSRSIGLIEPKIRIINETADRIIGFIADERGTRLQMYNNEQVVMVKYYLEDSSTSDWQMAGRIQEGFFVILVPEKIVGKVQSARVFIGNNGYTVNDAELETKQSWVFINSAQAEHKLGSLINLGPLTLGFERLLPNVAYDCTYDGDYQVMCNSDGYDDYSYLKEDEVEVDGYIVISRDLGESDSVPVMSNITDRLIEANSKEGAYVRFSGLIAHDKEDGDLSNNITCTPKSGSFFPVGSLTTIDCKVTDSQELSGTATFNIRIIDTVSPVFLTQLRNITTEYDRDGLATVWYEFPISSDIADNTPFVRCSPSPGSAFDIGISLVECIATDESGNVAVSSFPVVVAEAPAFTSLQAKIDINPFYLSNTINLRHETLVSVALLGNTTLNVREIDENTLRFGPNGAPLSDSASPYISDVNADGYDDVVLKFGASEAGLYEGYNKDACLTGLLDDRKTVFEGCDIANVIRK